jgi:hypothetical protein
MDPSRPLGAAFDASYISIPVPAVVMRPPAISPKEQ